MPHTTDKQSTTYTGTRPPTEPMQQTHQELRTSRSLMKHAVGVYERVGARSGQRRDQQR